MSSRFNGRQKLEARNIGSSFNKKLRGVNAKFDTDVVDDNKLPDSVLDRLKDDGVNTIFLCTTLLAPGTTSAAVAPVYPAAKFQAIYNRVKAKGFKVGFKPHFSGSVGGTGSAYNPADVGSFFVNYKAAFTAYTAGLTFDYVSVSNELFQLTSANLTNWTDFITWAKVQQPLAKVTTSGTLEELKTNVFLSQLDYIGLNAYLQMKNGAYPYTNPTLKDVIDNYFLDGFNEQFIPTLQDISAQYGKQLIVTEVGTTPFKESLQSTALTYVTGTGSANAVGNSTADEATQALYYQAIFALFTSCDFLHGFALWSITDNFSFLNPSSYPAIVSRQAESVVIDYWGKPNKQHITDALANYLVTNGKRMLHTGNHGHIGRVHNQYQGIYSVSMTPGMAADITGQTPYVQMAKITLKKWTYTQDFYYAFKIYPLIASYIGYAELTIRVRVNGNGTVTVTAFQEHKGATAFSNIINTLYNKVTDTAVDASKGGDLVIDVYVNPNRAYMQLSYELVKAVNTWTSAQYGNFEHSAYKSVTMYDSNAPIIDKNASGNILQALSTIEKSHAYYGSAFGESGQMKVNAGPTKIGDPLFMYNLGGATGVVTAGNLGGNNALNIITKDFAGGSATFTLDSSQKLGDIIQLTNMGAASIVKIPLETRRYIIQNQAAYQATIQPVTGAGTSVVAPANSVSRIFCDGINIISW